ncbi:MAG: ACT domain-containing protein [Chloroflexi bacterium]|nr:ACT domain-containing protein [Chloroflexota bacterium]
MICTLALEPDWLAICRLDARAPIPEWARGDFVALTRTRDELAIVCAQANVPDGIACERDWRALRVIGKLDFALTGVLVALAAPLADAGISIFAISTFDTDYVLVKARDLEKAIRVLREARHTIEERK